MKSIGAALFGAGSSSPRRRLSPRRSRRARSCPRISADGARAARTIAPQVQAPQAAVPERAAAERDPIGRSSPTCAPSWTSAAADRIDARRAAPRRRPGRAVQRAGIAAGGARPLIDLIQARPICRRPPTSPASPARAAHPLPYLPEPQRLVAWQPAAPPRAAPDPRRRRRRRARATDPAFARRRPAVRGRDPVQRAQRRAERGSAHRLPAAHRPGSISSATTATPVASPKKACAASPNGRSTASGSRPSPPGALADYDAAARHFAMVGSRATDVELAAAGHFWAARADTAAGRPQQVQQHFQQRGAAQRDLLRPARADRARHPPATRPARAFTPEDWRTLAPLSNVRAAVALTEIGETGLAGDLLRHQARIGGSHQHRGAAPPRRTAQPDRRADVARP